MRDGHTQPGRGHTQLLAATPADRSCTRLGSHDGRGERALAASGGRGGDEWCVHGFPRSEAALAQGSATSVPCADRLAELRVGMPSASADIEAGMLGSGSSQSPAMTSFFDEVSAVKQNMQTIKYNIKLIEQSHGECLTAISSEQQRACTDRLEGLMKETNAAAQTVRVRV